MQNCITDGSQVPKSDILFFCSRPQKIIWLVVWTPLKNISQLGWLFPIYGKIKNVPNHQPVMYRQRSYHTPSWSFLVLFRASRFNPVCRLATSKPSTAPAAIPIQIWRMCRSWGGVWTSHWVEVSMGRVRQSPLFWKIKIWSPSKNRSGLVLGAGTFTPASSMAGSMWPATSWTSPQSPKTNLLGQGLTSTSDFVTGCLATISITMAHQQAQTQAVTRCSTKWAGESHLHRRLLLRPHPRPLPRMWSWRMWRRSCLQNRPLQSQWLIPELPLPLPGWQQSTWSCLLSSRILQPHAPAISQTKPWPGELLTTCWTASRTIRLGSTSWIPRSERSCWHQTLRQQSLRIWWRS